MQNIWKGLSNKIVNQEADDEAIEMPNLKRKKSAARVNELLAIKNRRSTLTATKKSNIMMKF